MHDLHAQKVLRDYPVLPERLYINSNEVDNQNLNLLLFAFMLEWLYYIFDDTVQDYFFL